MARTLCSLQSREAKALQRPLPDDVFEIVMHWVDTDDQAAA
jgi:hypothetical protein